MTDEIITTIFVAMVILMIIGMLKIEDFLLLTVLGYAFLKFANINP